MCFRLALFYVFHPRGGSADREADENAKSRTERAITPARGNSSDDYTRFLVGYARTCGYSLQTYPEAEPDELTYHISNSE